MQIAILGGGCFWCTEAVFRQIRGVQQVESGYAGGSAQTAHYPAVCTGTTQHAEVIRIHYDENIIDFNTLLDIFFTVHDATTLNRQGNDIGSQYRSVIFYTNEKQKDSAQQKIRQLQQQGIAVVTEVVAANTFYPAEVEHQNFFALHPTQRYCLFTIPPKLEKLQQYFKPYLK